jgi:hypothetical protein
MIVRNPHWLQPKLPGVKAMGKWQAGALPAAMDRRAVTNDQ